MASITCDVNSSGIHFKGSCEPKFPRRVPKRVIKVERHDDLKCGAKSR